MTPEIINNHVIGRKNIVIDNYGYHQLYNWSQRDISRKLDQGALGMSDPCGTLQLALKPNSVPRI